MITFTKEQLIASAHARIEFAEMMLSGELEPLKERTWSIELALARIALASLEAEAAIHRWRRVTVEPYGPYPWHYGDFIGVSKPVDGIEDEYYYAAPPAPVSMKDYQIRELVNELRDIAIEYQGTQQLRERIARTVRAAMLQGAEPVKTAYKLPDDFDFDRFNDVVWLEAVASNPHMHSLTTSTIAMVALELNKRLEAGNSPVIPDGWVACSERMPEEGSKVIVFRPRASESNDPPVKTATYKGGREYYHGFDCYCEPTHWMPMPAAPQQEVK